MRRAVRVRRRRVPRAGEVRGHLGKPLVPVDVAGGPFSNGLQPGHDVGRARGSESVTLRTGKACHRGFDLRFRVTGGGMTQVCVDCLDHR